MPSARSRPPLVAIVVAAFLGLTALFATPAQAAPNSLVALGTGVNKNTLFEFSSANPSIVTLVPVSGVGSSTLVGIAFRPATGGLYGLGLNGITFSLYTIDPATGSAALAGSMALIGAAPATAFGMDFNPVADRLRVVDNLVSDGGSGNVNNFRLTPTGALASADSDLDFSGLPGGATEAPEVAVAYDRGVAGTTATTLYGIVSQGKRLVMQGGPDGLPSANGGVLSSIGLLGIEIGEFAGFDIDSASNAGYAAFTVGATSSLYEVNLGTGQATKVGAIGNGTAQFAGLAIEPPAASPQTPTTPTASTSPPPQPPTPAEARIESLKLTPTAFAPAGGATSSKAGRKAARGATVRYSLSLAVTVSFQVEKARVGRKVGNQCKKQSPGKAKGKGKTCQQYIPVGAPFTKAGSAGSNSFEFSGRLGAAALKPGPYRLTGTAGKTSANAKFRIVPAAARASG